MIVPLDKIENKFSFVVVASKRARQLQGGARPLIESLAHKPTCIAMEEVLANAVAYEMPQLGPRDEPAGKKAKKKK